MPGAIRIFRHTASTGALIDEITAPVLLCESEYRLYGGCSRCALEFETAWGDDFVAELDEELIVTSGDVPVFAGRVVDVIPSYDKPKQRVEVSGWCKRLDELPVAVAPADRMNFGDCSDSHEPTITTAFGVVQWLLANVIETDTESAITGILGTTVIAPSAPCKLGKGGFSIYASDKLTDIFEKLAAMEDCACGVDASRRFYFVPRATLSAVDPSASGGIQVRCAEAAGAGWKTSNKGYALGGNFTQARRGPNHLALTSRDAALRQGTRTYRYVGALDGSRRVAQFYAPQVRSGQSARRLAKGLFRRFANYGVKIENLEVIHGTRRFEPHLGRVDVYDAEELYTSGLAGSVTVRWGDVPRVSVTLGEDKSDAGGGNPLNDPFAENPSKVDDPQIDTGDGESDEDYPIPSVDIDEDDGFDGDGDDLFTNGDRDDWTDPSAGDGVDYGTDLADSTFDDRNLYAKRYPCIVTEVLSADANGDARYKVTIYRNTLKGAAWLVDQTAYAFPVDALLTTNSYWYVQQEPRFTGVPGTLSAIWVIDATGNGTGSSGAPVLLVPYTSYLEG